LETRNSWYISAIKRISYGGIEVLAVAGDKKIIEFFLIINESTANFQMSKEIIW
jgi:hypothetical protein